MFTPDLPKKFDNKYVAMKMILPWADNPRHATDEDIARLKKQIDELGVYKPLICAQENGKYVVLGGNMRYRAYRELKHTHAWIVVVKAKTKAQKLKYALSDNDRVGWYDEEMLHSIASAEKVDFTAFKIDTTLPEVNVSDILDINKQIKTGSINKRKNRPKIDTTEKTLNLGFTFKNQDQYVAVKKKLGIAKNQHVAEGDILYHALNCD